MAWAWVVIALKCNDLFTRDELNVELRLIQHLGTQIKHYVSSAVVLTTQATSLLDLPILQEFTPLYEKRKPRTHQWRLFPWITYLIYPITQHFDDDSQATNCVSWKLDGFYNLKSTDNLQFSLV